MLSPNLSTGQEADRVFESLKDKILTGELPSGSKLNEKALTELLGTSRGSIRESLRRLQERELVTYRANVGARVRTHTPDDVIDSYHTREALEGMAARLAADNITEDELAQVRVAIDDRVEMHLIIVRASRSETLISLLGERHFDLQRKLRMDFPHMHAAGPDSFFEHEMIYHALKLRDPDLAETVMRRHIARLRRSITLNLSIEHQKDA